MVVSSGHVRVTTYDGTLCINEHTGAVFSSRKTDGDSIMISDGRILVPLDGRETNCLEERTGSLLWSSPADGEEITVSDNKG